MVKLPLSEFDDLLYTASFLKYYWLVFSGMTENSTNLYSHADFVLDFIKHDRLKEFTSVKRNAFNKILLTSDQLQYLQHCCTVTTELKHIVFDGKNVFP